MERAARQLESGNTCFGYHSRLALTLVLNILFYFILFYRFHLRL